MKRHLVYITGTRADFGLMRSTLLEINRSEAFNLSLIVSGMHLSSKYGMTANEIKNSGLPIRDEVINNVDDVSNVSVAKNIGIMVQGFSQALYSNPPDCVILLGDRGEMLAGAIAALSLNIPIVHIHGGERSGTVDEPVRHAISKLSNFHFVSTNASRDRLIRMGEEESNIWVTGAPGLDDLRKVSGISLDQVLSEYGFVREKKLAIMVFHPDNPDSLVASQETQEIMEQLISRDIQFLALMPNSDPSSDGIRGILKAYEGHKLVRLITHLPRDKFVQCLLVSNLLIGNSSSGIIEAASFGTPVVNIGDRQKFRERNANTIDAKCSGIQIGAAIDQALKKNRYPLFNIYGDGNSGRIILDLLRVLPLGKIMVKSNAY